MCNFWLILNSSVNVQITKDQAEEKRTRDKNLGRNLTSKGSAGSLCYVVKVSLEVGFVKAFGQLADGDLNAGVFIVFQVRSQYSGTVMSTAAQRNLYSV